MSVARIIFLTYLLLLASCSIRESSSYADFLFIPAPVPGRSPQEAAKSLYSDPRFFGSRGWINSEEIALLLPCLTPSLTELLRRTERDIKAWLRQYANTEPRTKLPYLEGCTFTGFYEHPQSFRIADVVKSGNVASVAIHFLYSEHGKAYRWKDEAKFVYSNDRWLLDDITLNAGTDEQMSLREHLKFDPK